MLIDPKSLIAKAQRNAVDRIEKPNRKYENKWNYELNVFFAPFVWKKKFHAKAQRGYMLIDPKSQIAKAQRNAVDRIEKPNRKYENKMGS